MVENKQIFAVTRLQIQMSDYPAWCVAAMAMMIMRVVTMYKHTRCLCSGVMWCSCQAGSTMTHDSLCHGIGHSLMPTRGLCLATAPGVLFNTNIVFFVDILYYRQRSSTNIHSTWVVVNMETRRLNKLPPSMHAMIQRFKPGVQRFAVSPSEAKRKIPEVAEPFDIVGPVQVARRSDMDMNGHINNVTYLAWTLETVPEDVFAHGKLCQVCMPHFAGSVVSRTLVV